MSRYIEADALIKKFQSDKEYFDKVGDTTFAMATIGVINDIEDAPTIEVPKWIPCEERLPEDIGPVLVTWKNNDPASYYQYIVGKHFIGTAHYHRGKWYWYSSVTEDLLAEYGKCETEEFDEAIEAVAWMPLPKPYEETDHE